MLLTPRQVRADAQLRAAFISTGHAPARDVHDLLRAMRTTNARNRRNRGQIFRRNLAAMLGALLAVVLIAACGMLCGAALYLLFRF